MEFNWHAILLQALCVAEPVVAQGVGSGYLDDGGWEAGEGLSEERGYFGVRCGTWLIRLCISKFGQVRVFGGKERKKKKNAYRALG